MSLLDYYLANKPLVEKIKVIVSKKCSYDTVVWGSCIDGRACEEYCALFRKAGVPVYVTYKKGNAAVPCHRFKWEIKGKYTPQAAKRAYALLETMK